MGIESILDEKGRICIPVEVRKKLNLRTGEKLFFQIKNNDILIKKAVEAGDFIKQVKELQESIKKGTKEPIKFEKIIE